MKNGVPAVLLALMSASLFAAPGDEFWDAQFGSPGVDGYSVGAMALGRGQLFVGGTFLSVGSVPATNIAAWDGKNWHSLGPGIGTGLRHGISGMGLW